MLPALHRLLARLLLIASLGWLIAATPAAALSDEANRAVAGLPVERLALMVTINGVTAPDAIVVERQGPVVWMAAEELRKIGVPVPPEQQRVALQSIPRLTFTIDDTKQTLAITFGAPAKQRLSAARPMSGDTVPITPSGWGGVVSYDVSAGREAGGSVAGGLIEGTVYSPHGYAYAGAIVTSGDQTGTQRVYRLDTNVTIADPARMRRITIGDFIDRTNSFTRPVRMAGLQITTDFGLRPDLVTFPVPAINAQAAVPSAVDLIVNGSRHRAGDVSAGSFSVSDVPVQTGLNTISVAVRDALGRERLQTVTTYTSAALLTRGLSAYSIAGGFVRTGYATDDDRYRDFVLSGGWRRGMSDMLTLEAHGEVARNLATSGVGAVIAMNRLGLMETTIAGSIGTGRQRSGVQLTAAWERIAHPVAVSARLTLASNGWRDVAARYGSITRRHTFVMNVSFDLGRFGSLSGSLLDLGRGRFTSPLSGVSAFASVEERQVDATRYAVATYSVRASRRLGFVASAGGDLRQRRSFYASLGLIVTFGSRGTGYAGALTRDGQTSARVDVARPALVTGDIGYRASAATGGIHRVAGGVEYLGTHGFYDLQAERTNGQVAVRASARGSLVMAGGGLFATDRLDSGFAVVDTNGQPGVAIFRDHRRIGKTDRHGRMIVANLPAYESTRIAFDPADLPVEASTADSDILVKPAERAGARVRFRIYRDSALAVRVVTATGAPLPVGTRATINGVNDLPIGFDGALYLLISQPHNHLVAHTPDGHDCEARFARPATYVIGGDPIVATCRELAVATAAKEP